LSQKGTKTSVTDYLENNKMRTKQSFVRAYGPLPKLHLEKKKHSATKCFIIKQEGIGINL
jgi:hypothetical protein